MKKTTPFQYIVIYSLLLLFVAWSIYPILRVVTISIRPGDNLLNESLSIIPNDWSLENYVKLFTEQPFLRWLRNSILVTAVVMFTGVALASTAGYALSRFRFPGREGAMQPFGQPLMSDPASAPVQPVGFDYLANAAEETGAANAVMAVLLDYRAYDTLGEATVIFVSILGVYAILRRVGRKKNESFGAEMNTEQEATP